MVILNAFTSSNTLERLSGSGSTSSASRTPSTAAAAADDAIGSVSAESPDNARPCHHRQPQGRLSLPPPLKNSRHRVGIDRADHACINAGDLEQAVGAAPGTSLAVDDMPNPPIDARGLDDHRVTNPDGQKDRPIHKRRELVHLF